MDLWIVTYRYRGSRYFDSPLYRVEKRMSFRTLREARAWADGQHPDLPDYQTLGIHKEGQIVDRHPEHSAQNYYSAERYWGSDGYSPYGRH